MTTNGYLHMQLIDWTKGDHRFDTLKEKKDQMVQNILRVPPLMTIHTRTHLLSPSYPSCLQTTAASAEVHWWSQIVPQRPL